MCQPAGWQHCAVQLLLTSHSLQLTALLQDDTFTPTQTSQETLTFYAAVTLGEGWSHSSRKGRVAEVLDAVGLGHAADTLVSD